MRFHQIVSTGSMADASMQFARRIHHYLLELDRGSAIFSSRGAEHASATTLDDTRSTDELILDVDDALADSVVLVHSGALSEADATLTNVLCRRSAAVVVVDLGSRSGDDLLRFEPAAAGTALAVEAHLAMLAERGSSALVFSAERAARLSTLGFAPVVQLEPLVDVDLALQASTHLPTSNHFDSNVDGPLIVTSGAISPEFALELQVEAYHVLTTHIDPRAHLAMTGRVDSGRYQECLEHQVNELNLNKAWMTGALDADTLHTYLERADVVVSTKRCEADFVSLTHAMAFGVPVLATYSPGLSECCGDAALVLPEDAGPLLIAEAMHVLIDDDELRGELVRRGKERISQLRSDRSIDSALRCVLGAIVR